ncbi:hypothetical protein, partial [Kingella kingae]|uniref:hypothetical protein n=1 Tax=Kingella kingae TaxID=504 RepID=UPI001E4C3C55
MQAVFFLFPQQVQPFLVQAAWFRQAQLRFWLFFLFFVQTMPLLNVRVLLRRQRVWLHVRLLLHRFVVSFRRLVGAR